MQIFQKLCMKPESRCFLQKTAMAIWSVCDMEAFEKLYFLKARSVLNCRRLSGKPS